MQVLKIRCVVVLVRAAGTGGVQVVEVVLHLRIIARLEEGRIRQQRVRQVDWRTAVGGLVLPHRIERTGASAAIVIGIEANPRARERMAVDDEDAALRNRSIWRHRYRLFGRDWHYRELNAPDSDPRSSAERETTHLCYCR